MSIRIKLFLALRESFPYDRNERTKGHRDASPEEVVEMAKMTARLKSFFDGVREFDDWGEDGYEITPGAKRAYEKRLVEKVKDIISEEQRGHWDLRVSFAVSSYQDFSQYPVEFFVFKPELYPRSWGKTVEYKG